MKRRRTRAMMIAALLAVASACVSTERAIDTYSYDVGWAYGAQELCIGFEQVFGSPAQRDDLGPEASEALVDRWNGYVTRAIASTTLVEGLDVTYFLSGMWDSATEQCQEWFPTPSLAGRPGGGDVLDVDVPRIDGLEAGQFIEVARDQLNQVQSSPTTAVPTTLSDPAADYPRAPTPEEIDAIADHYIARNEAARSLATLRAFWLATAHPSLGCTERDIELILLPEADDPLWDTPVVFTPDLDSLVMVAYDDRLGPVAEVNRTNRTGADSIQSAPVRDRFFVVDGMAHMYHDCEAAPSAQESIDHSPEIVQQVFFYTHTAHDFDAPSMFYFVELLTSERASLDSPEDFVSAMRWSWDQTLDGVSDQELVDQGQIVCDALRSDGGAALHDQYHESNQGATTDTVLWGREMFYASGLVFCIDEPEWEDWVHQDLIFGFDINIEDLTTQDEMESGLAAISTKDEWTEFMIGLITATLEKPLARPVDFGLLKALGASRVLVEGNS